MQKSLRSKSPTYWSLARRLKRLAGKAALTSGLITAGWLFSGEVKAQAPANYVFAASSGTYTPVGANATAVPLIIADSEISGAIPLGFTFNYAGTDYTTVYASSNGFLSFNPGAATETSNSPASSTSTGRPLVAPLWDDLKGTATLGSTASYETTGAPGSRVFTFQWQNWLWLYSATAPNISFQAKLYEATGKIEFVYQQEAGALSTTTPSASIGITAAATGSGNYLNLNNATANPTASSTTATTNISTKPATGQIYAFSKPAIDVSAIAINPPATPACYGATETITVTVRNTGEATLNFATNPLTVNLAATGANAFTFPAVTVNTGTLAPNATQNVVISTPYNMTAAGTHTFNGTATVTGDASTANNTFPAASRTVYPVATLPQSVNFTGFTGANLTTLFPNWRESTTATLPTNTNSTWGNSATVQSTFFGSTNAKLNFPTSTSTTLGEWIIGPRITPTATTALSFLAAVTSSGGTATAAMLPTDSVNVMVSTNCGLTFKKVGSVSGSNNLTNALTNFTFNLGAYSGQEIMVAIVGKNGTARPTAAYDFILDDLFLGNPPVLDIGATFLISPVTGGCYSANETATITIRNYGNTPINFATNPVTVTVNVTGAATQTLTTTVNTGTLAAGASQNVIIPTPLNMSVAGTYTFNATATVTGDERTSNDAITAVTRTVTAIQVSAPVALPQSVDFTGFTDANLTTLFPNWYEATGAALPSGTTSGWAKQTGLGTATNVTAKVNLYSNSKNEWIVGPKVTATASTALLFKVAITDYSFLTPDPEGMAGTDDKVRVMVSTDCGTTFNPIFTFDASNTATLSNVLTSQYISLASYAGQNIIVAIMASEGTVDNTPDYDFHIDDIFIGTPPALDLGLTALITPLSTGCYTATEPVAVTIRNFGSTPLDFTTTPATVTVNVTGAATQTLTGTVNTGTLAPGATQNVTVGNLDMTPAGTYTFNGSASITGDADANNNAMPVITRTVIAPVALPQAVNFTAFDGTNLTAKFPNWKEATGTTTPTGTTSAWTSSAAAQSTFFGSTTAKLNFPTSTSTNLNEWIVSAKVTATPTTAMAFKAAVTTSAATAAATMLPTDSLKVMVSNNCGVTFTKVGSVSGSNNLTTALSDFTFDLSSYAGQNIIVALVGKNGSARPTAAYDLILDDIFLGTPPPLDMGVSALVSPVLTTACLTNAEPLIVTIKNYHAQPINFATDSTIVTVNVTGALTQTFTAKIKTGTLASGATQNVTLGNVNMSAPGTYTFNSFTTLNGDGNPTNNAMAPVSITNGVIAAFPFKEDFETFTTGTNATGFAKGWTVTPANTTADYRWNVQAGKTPSSDTGPTNDHTLGSTTGKFIFTEASSGATGAVAELISPCINLAGQTSIGMEFWYHMYGATVGTLNVDVFNGTAWVNGAFTISGQQQTSTTAAWRKATVDLSSYSGSVIKVRFRAVRGTDFTGDLAVDDVTFYIRSTVDVGAVALAGPSTVGCFGAAEPVVVTIENNGLAPLDLAVNPATVTVNVTGAVTQTLTATLNTGTIAMGATQNVTVGTLNMTAPGTYTFNATATATGDLNTINAVMPAATRTLTAPVALPQAVDFTAFTGANLTTLFPNWYEATGATAPAGTTSSWVNTTGLGGTSNVTAKINLYTTGKNEWIVGPKVTATANTTFRFKVAITDYAAVTADPAGMQGTDDKVQVMVSTDCGFSFTPIYTFNAANTVNLTNVLTEQNVSLGTYAGQSIIVAIMASEGTTDDTPDYDFHIDDLSISNIPAVDLGAVALANPTVMTGCYGNAQNVVVTVKNLGSAPLDFAATNATLTVNVTGTGGAAQTLTFTLNNNSLNNGAPLSVFGTLNVPVGVLNMSGIGTYIFNGTASATGDGNTTNDALTATTITTAAPVAGTASASLVNICQSGTTTLKLTGNSGGDIQWQQATSATGTFTNITGANTANFTLPTALTQTTYFKAIVACGNSSVTTNTVTVAVSNPLVTASSGGANCGPGTISLSATPSAGTTINWFDTATGGASLATGNTYAPNVTATTTYYAEASIGTPEKLGKSSTNGVDGTNTGGGLIFNAASPFTLDSVVVYSAITGGGSLVVNLKNSAGTILQTATVTLPAVTARTAIVVPLNFNVPAGTGLRLEQGSALALNRDYTASAGITYPYTTPSQIVTITDGTLAGYYYFFYRWSVTTKCASARTAVVATVNALPTPVITGLNAAYCQNAAAVTLAGTPTGSTFTIDGVAATSFNPATLGVGTHTVVMSNTNAANCTASATQTVTVTANPVVPTITAGGATTFCQGGSVTLTGASTTTGATYAWFLNGTAITGATSATYTANAAGNYTVVATTNGCDATSTATSVTVNPTPTTPTITRLNMVLTSSAATGATYQWYLNGTAIPGATSQTYTVAANGNYTVVVTTNGCASAASAATNITNTGLNAELATMGISIYPNPNQGKFDVKLTGYSKKATLNLYNLTGQLIRSQEVNVTANEVTTPMHIENLAAGTYLLKVTSEKGMKVERLIVQ